MVPLAHSLESRVETYSAEVRSQLEIMRRFDSVLLTKANKAELLLLKSNAMELNDANEMEANLREQMYDIIKK